MGVQIETEIKIVINLPNKNDGSTEIRFFKFDDNDESIEVTPSDLRQLILLHSKKVAVTVSFGDGHETVNPVPLIDILGDSRPILYARRESTTDKDLLARNESEPFYDIVLYSNSAITEIVFRYPWYYTEQIPSYRDSSFIHDGRAYNLIWLSDLEPVVTA